MNYTYIYVSAVVKKQNYYNYNIQLHNWEDECFP